MHRIVRYDGKSLKFKDVTLTRNIAFAAGCIAVYEIYGDFVEVYRCNEKGNNYSGRKIYPYPEIKNLTPDERRLYAWNS